MSIGEQAAVFLEQRWREVFASLGDGLDVPPGLRLRTEGAMELAAALGLLTPEEQCRRLADCYAAVRGEALPEDWQVLCPFPQLPGFMARAPVYPTTREE